MGQLSCQDVDQGDLLGDQDCPRCLGRSRLAGGGPLSSPRTIREVLGLGTGARSVSTLTDAIFTEHIFLPLLESCIDLIKSKKD